jgi:hypothetical protein
MEVDRVKANRELDSFVADILSLNDVVRAAIEKLTCVLK